MFSFFLVTDHCIWKPIMNMKKVKITNLPSRKSADDPWTKGDTEKAEL